MELEDAKAIWGRSEDYNIVYRYMISDEQSKPYNAIWKFYGVCGLCNENEELYKSLKEYEITAKKRTSSTKNETALILQGQQIVIVS